MEDAPPAGPEPSPEHVPGEHWTLEDWRCPRCGFQASTSEATCPRCFASAPGRADRLAGLAREPRETTEHAATSALFWIYALLLATNVGLAWTLSDLPDVSPWSDAVVDRAVHAMTVVAALDTLLVLAAWGILGRRIAWTPGPPGKARATWCLALPVMALLLAVNLAYHWSLLELAGVEPETDELVASGKHTAWLLVLTCVQPAVIEELFFRRLAFDFFLAHTGAGTAAFASSAMFAAAHTGALSSFPVLLAFGGVMAWMRWRTGSLVLPMLMHFLHNLVISAYDLASA